MPRVKTAKGKVIDFDLLKIKKQMAGKPVSIDVKARQQFIDQKARRRLRKVAKQAAAASIKVDDEALIEAEPTEARPIVEKPETVPAVEKHHHRTKQKVRPPTDEE